MKLYGLILLTITTLCSNLYANEKLVVYQKDLSQSQVDVFCDSIDCISVVPVRDHVTAELMMQVTYRYTREITRPVFSLDMQESTARIFCREIDCLNIRPSDTRDGEHADRLQRVTYEYYRKIESRELCHYNEYSCNPNQDAEEDKESDITRGPRS
ncbi:hypothetical protein [Pleionea sediminis]|uniref:hypothetical protein n=1 Tax=Pleionea sediminis TaxID=2569479 RepID=UPI001185691E|nr:hypothetical protein [Pleionea sediminis]